MMKIEIKGLDRLQRDLTKAQRGLESLHDTIDTLRFNPEDPLSVQAAIQQMESAVDAKIAPYSRNELLARLAVKMKAAYRKKILERVKRDDA